MGCVLILDVWVHSLALFFFATAYTRTQWTHTGDSMTLLIMSDAHVYTEGSAAEAGVVGTPGLCAHRVGYVSR